MTRLAEDFLTGVFLSPIFAGDDHHPPHLFPIRLQITSDAIENEAMKESVKSLSADSQT